MDKNIKMKDIKELGEQLGELQRVCREKKIPVMIAFEGYGAAGKGLQIGNLIQHTVIDATSNISGGHTEWRI